MDEVKKEKEVVKKSKLKLKKGVLQTVFNLVSLTFIIGCCVFYGSRLIKYYKIYNPKLETGETVELISNALVKNTEIVFEGDGLYRTNGVYVYKGETANNYIEFSNMLWRIVKTNVDGTVEMILEDYINILKWDFEKYDYKDSDVNKYLNEVFAKNLNTDLLSKTLVCLDKVDSLTNITCNESNTDYYVKLLSLSDFVNSKTDTTFVSKDEELVWLHTSSEDKVWHSNGANVSQSTADSNYFVKPVVTLKNSTQLLGGTGTKEDPYKIEKEDKKIGFASYVQLGEDLWQVYAIDEKEIKLVLTSLYNDGNTTYRFDVSENIYDVENDNSLAKYLNTEFYDKLSYEDLIIDGTWYIGTYENSYEDVYKETVNAKVGIYNVADIKLDSSVMGYNLSTPSEEGKVYYYNNNLISSKVTLSRGIRPTITIENQKANEGNGTVTNPFVIEVQNEEA